MSTNAESAKKWVQENNPDNATLLNFIQKLEDRLDKMDVQDPNWDGNEQALNYLQEVVESNHQEIKMDVSGLTENESVSTNNASNLDTSSLHSNQSFEPNWDASSLTPHVEVKPQLDADKKRALFEQLKKQVQD